RPRRASRRRGEGGSGPRRDAGGGGAGGGRRARRGEAAPRRAGSGGGGEGDRGGAVRSGWFGGVLGIAVACAHTTSPPPTSVRPERSEAESKGAPAAVPAPDPSGTTVQTRFPHLVAAVEKALGVRRGRGRERRR